MPLARPHGYLQRLRQLDSSRQEHSLGRQPGSQAVGRGRRHLQGSHESVAPDARRSTKSSVLPMAAMYADTRIVLNGTSNAYAVQPDGTFVPATSQYAYNIMAGGSYTNNSNQVVTGNNGTTLRPPTGTAQSLGFRVNGTVSLPGVNENGVIPGGVGLLSDYFDQARQYALTVEAQSGMGTAGLAMHNDTTAPTAPARPTTLSRTTAQFTQAALASYYNATTKVYTIPSVNVTGGNLTLSAASFPAGASFNFTGTLYVDTGGLTVTGNLPITVATLKATGLTISGATTTITDNLGTVYVTGTTTVSGRVALTTNSTATSYFAGAFSHTPSTAVTDNLGPLYFGGNAAFSSASGNLTIAGGKNVHAGGTFTITGPTSSSNTVPCVFGSLYSVAASPSPATRSWTRRTCTRAVASPSRGTLPASPTSSDPSTSPARRTGTAARRALVCASRRPAQRLACQRPSGPTRPRRRRCSPRSSPLTAIRTATTTATAGPTTSCSATCGWTATPAPATWRSTSRHRRPAPQPPSCAPSWRRLRRRAPTATSTSAPC